MSTVAQKWAQERNWNKAQLVGIHGRLWQILLNDSTTKRERRYLIKARNALGIVLPMLRQNNALSKKQFIKLKGDNE